jgi:hypothetical protein
MNKTKGYANTQARIRKIRFLKGKIIINLVDDRILIIPSAKFPEINQLTPAQKRKHKTLAGLGLMFDDLDTVFHISDFMGKDLSFKISGIQKISSKKNSGKRSLSSKANDPRAKYRKR